MQIKPKRLFPYLTIYRNAFDKWRREEVSIEGCDTAGLSELQRRKYCLEILTAVSIKNVKISAQLAPTVDQSVWWGGG